MQRLEHEAVTPEGDYDVGLLDWLARVAIAQAFGGSLGDVRVTGHEGDSIELHRAASLAAPCPSSRAVRV